MNALILAAGRGSRLGGYTDDMPKCLLPLSEGQALLDYNLRLLNELGLDRAIIVTGYCADQIEAHVREAYEGVDCVYNPFWDCCNVLGSLYLALPYVSDSFVFLHADTLVGSDAWREMLSIDADMVLPFQRKACGAEEMKISVDSQGHLTGISKDLNLGDSDGEFLGIAKFSDAARRYFLSTAPQLMRLRGRDLYMESVLDRAIGSDCQIATFEIGNTPFVEVDFEEDYNRAKNLFGAPR